MALATAPNDLTVALRARAEALLTCPLCGKSGALTRIGGGSGASRFRCTAYRYDPNRANVCRFVFRIDDRELVRVR